MAFCSERKKAYLPMYLSTDTPRCLSAGTACSCPGPLIVQDRMDTNKQSLRSESKLRHNLSSN
jgi:hypothetical protein